MATLAAVKTKKKNELLFFALKNAKLRIGLSIVLIFIAIALVGPFFTKNKPLDFVAPGVNPPSNEFPLGTTALGEDVMTQLVYGLGMTFVVGFLGGGIATLIGVMVGFVAGYRGGWVDELLNMLTNVVLVIPSLVVLIILAAYLDVRGVFIEGVFIGCFNWPWTARAVRAQTFSLRSRDFVDLARMSGVKPLKIIVSEIAPNMMSYLLLVLIMQFGGAILTAATLDFIGLGPTNGTSLGMMMNNAVIGGALIIGYWWWFIPPGLLITALVGSLYITNVGLDEVFNPKLREM